MTQTAKVIELVRLHGMIARLIRPHLFKHVRLGYAVWHLLAVSKRPLDATEVFEGVTLGSVFTMAEDFTVKNVENALRYHTRVGKLRYMGRGTYTIK